MEKRNKGLSFLGIDPTLGIGQEILDHAQTEKKKHEERSCYAVCPSCGKRQFKRDLIESGCFICKWKGNADEVELALAKDTSHSKKPETGYKGYKKKCPHCGAILVIGAFQENGCYICGYNED